MEVQIEGETDLRVGKLYNRSNKARIDGQIYTNMRLFSEWYEKMNSVFVLVLVFCTEKFEFFSELYNRIDAKS